MKNTVVISLLALSAVFATCKKEDPKPEPETPVEEVPAATMKLNFEHRVGSDLLEFDETYVNAKGDSFTVNKFIYYISNVVFHKSDNSTYTVPESYYLVDHQKNDSKTITISNIPPGTYKGVSFMLGVDSLRNVSGVQSGALAVSNNMFWTWSSGYIFLKLEGSAPKSPNGNLTYHIGGFKGENNALRTFNFSFGDNIGLNNKEVATLLMSVDIAEMFKTPTVIDFSTFSFQMSAGPNAKQMADNYVDMISYKGHTK